MVDTSGGTIFSSNIFVFTILPFLLVFALVFAILQKTKILGDGKKQIDAIVALVIGLLVVSFANYVDVIVQLMAFLAVALVIILVFLLLFGSMFEPSKFEMAKGLKITFGIIIAIAVVIAVLVYTPAWEYLKSNLVGKGGSGWLINTIFVVLIIAAIAVVLVGKGEKKS